MSFHLVPGRARHAVGVLLVMSALAVVAVVTSRPALAGVTIVVNSTADTIVDDGACTLREAIAAANTNTDVGGCNGVGGDTADVINFNLPGCPCTITLGGTPLWITEGVTITGPAAPHLAIDGGGLSRVVQAGSISKVTIEGLTIRNGFDLDDGGGIKVFGAGTVLELERVVVTSNVVGPNGGGGTSCIGCAGAGIVAGAGSQLNLIRSTVSANSIAGTGATGAGLMIDAGATASLTNVTVAGNQTTGTVSEGGGIFVGGVLTLNHVTIADNSTGTNGGGGIRVLGASAVVNVRHSLIADNEAAANGPDCSVGGAGQFVSLDFNVIESVAGCTISGATANNVIGIDPGLGALGSNGGQTATMAIGPGSVALDAGENATCSNADQRGVARPADGDGVDGARCDIGAFEYQPPVVPTTTTTTTTTPPEPVLPVGVSRFVGLSPVRVFDTRVGEPGPGPKGVVPAGGTIDVQVTGVGGVPPSGVSAVVLNLTATDAGGAGFVTVWPAGQLRPLASSLNLTGVGQTRPNLVTVPVSGDGRVSVFTQAGGHLLGDIAGYYTPAGGPVAAGRVVPLTPARVLDTRVGEPGPGPKGLVAAGGSISVQVTGVGGVPPSGVSAVVLNVTATEAVAAGFVTVWPAGQVRPLASVLNVNGPGDTAPNLVMVPVGADGRVELFSQSGAHLLADVTGYVTDASSEPSTLGLFVPLAPVRVFDTRLGEPAPGPKGIVGPTARITVQVGGTVGIPADAAGIVANVTGIDATTAGFVTVWPTGQTQPVTSTLNLTAGDTRANAAILRLGDFGQINLYTQPAAHLLADTTGYYTG